MGSVVKCMFKRNIIVDNEITFPIGIHFAEDLIFTLKYLSYCQRTVVLNKVIYFYRFNSRSLMNSFDKYHNDMLFSRIKLISEIKKIMVATDIYEGNEVRIKYFGKSVYKRNVLVMRLRDRMGVRFLIHTRKFLRFVLMKLVRMPFYHMILKYEKQNYICINTI